MKREEHGDHKAGNLKYSRWSLTDGFICSLMGSLAQYPSTVVTNVTRMLVGATVTFGFGLH